MPTLNYRSPQPPRTTQTYEDLQARKQWLTPTILLSLAFVSHLLQLLLVDGAGAAAMGGGILVVAIVLQAIMVIGAAYITAMVAQTGFGSFWMAVLQLVAITFFAGAVISWLPIPGLFSLMVYFGLVIALIAGMMDLETSEAAVFAVVLTVVQIIASFAIVALFAG